LSHSAYLMRSALFISSKALRETQIYKFEMKSTVENWNTNFLGTYTPMNSSASRTPLTRPLPGDSLNQLPSVPINAPKGPKRPWLNGSRPSTSVWYRSREYEGTNGLYDS
jgi:hypothetical protein